MSPRLGTLLLAVGLLAGCGGTAASLDDAADATSAETARFELEFRISGEPEELNYDMQAMGSFDFPNERAVMQVFGDVPFFDASEAAFKEFRLIGTTGYARWLVKGKTYWVRSDESGPSGDATELLIPLPGTPTTPRDVLARVVAASDETEKLGEEEIRGTKTTHYRARVNVKKLVQQLPPKDRPDDADGAEFVPVEVWIDEDSRLRRITTEESVDGGKMTMAVELYDYGVDVDVEPPPEEETITEDEFDELDLSSAELESGEGEEMSPDEVCEDAREALPKKEADQVCASVKGKQ